MQGAIRLELTRNDAKALGRRRYARDNAETVFGEEYGWGMDADEVKAMIFKQYNIPKKFFKHYKLELDLIISPIR